MAFLVNDISIGSAVMDHESQAHRTAGHHASIRIAHYGLVRDPLRGLGE